ncbi:MAG: hypothetical protein U5K33_06685 [Halofilum sp. (in: g-proteobacteria)]|nr:hypothetical protein [Halofilum sp. (in: g-proteobacteria)]
MLYLHVGLHKTGTTYLQSEVFPFWSGVRYLRNLTVENFLRIDPAETCLASREGFSGPALGTREEKLAFLKRLSRMFPDARILISFRRHASYINALYSQYLRYGGTLPLSGFFDPDLDNGVLTRADILYRPYIEAIHEYWDRPPFVFLLSEIMEQPERLRSDLGDLFGCEPPEFRPARRSTRNASLGTVQAETLRRLNRLCGVQLHRDSRTRPYRVLRRLSLDPPRVCQRWSTIARGRPIMDRALAERIDRSHDDDWEFVRQCVVDRSSSSNDTPVTHPTSASC